VLVSISSASVGGSCLFALKRPAAFRELDMVYAHKVRVSFAVRRRRHVILLWGGRTWMDVPAAHPAARLAVGASDGACATTAVSDTLSTPREASCVAALLDVPLCL
jgi:hypothetical protein